MSSKVRDKIDSVRPIVKAIGLLVILLAIASTLFIAKKSSVFLLNSIVIEIDQPNYPVDESDVMTLVDIPLGQHNVFDVKLQPIQKRLLTHPWVKGVVIHQQLPDALRVHVSVRIPVAQMASKNGLIYLEADGNTFDPGALPFQGLLPMVSGFDENDASTLANVTQWIKNWQANVLDTYKIKMTSLDLSERFGFRATLMIPLSKSRVTRPVVELGMNLDEASGVPEHNMRQVFDMLQKKQWGISHIWMGNGKKIVVKRLTGS